MCVYFCVHVNYYYYFFISMSWEVGDLVSGYLYLFMNQQGISYWRFIQDPIPVFHM